jgi:hypothetical protein
MEKYIEQLEYLMALLAAAIFNTPGLILSFIVITIVCCIIACSAKTLKAICIPAAIVTILAIISFGVLYFIFKTMTGM